MYFGPTLNSTDITVERIVQPFSDEKAPWPLFKSKFFLSKYTGEGTIGAVLDTGTGSHYDLDENLIERLDYQGKKREPSNYSHFDHGTFTSGEAHASKQGSGMVGAAYKSKFYDIQALPEKRGEDPFKILFKCIHLAIGLNCDAINMSLGSTYDSSTVKSAVTYAEKAGIIVVAAAGNAGREGRIVSNYPADYPTVISVGSVNFRGLPSSYTQYSKSVEVSIGGEKLKGILPGNRFGVLSGTSMSSPLIYAVALRWCEKHPEIKKKDRPKKFRAELKKVVEDIYKDGYDNRTGWGYLNDVPSIASINPDEGLNYLIIT